MVLWGLDNQSPLSGFKCLSLLGLQSGLKESISFGNGRRQYVFFL